MKTTFYLSIVLFLLNSYADGQVIHGKVLDAKSMEAVRYANVYLEGTSIGSVTDNYGRFHFDIKSHRGIPIIVSTIGYKSKREPEYRSNQELTVYLEQKNYMLAETEIKARRITRSRRANYLREFKDEFLGRSSNAYRCEILNKKDILFEYDQEAKILYASSKKPLIIKNHGLGYQITYFLDHFISTRKEVFYDGYYFFNEIEPISQLEATQYSDNRFRAYRGSRLALIRAIYQENIEQKLFSLYDQNNDLIDLKEILRKLPDGEKEICLDQGLIVQFGYQPFERKSRLIPIDSCIRITKEGYFNGKSIKWTDHIAKKRVADLLPFEYKLTEKQKSVFDHMK